MAFLFPWAVAFRDIGVFGFWSMMAFLAVLTIGLIVVIVLFGGGILDHVAGLGIGFLLAYPFYAAGGLKAGDGKFLMAVGALKGTAFLLVGAVYGALIGGVIAIGFIVARRVAAARAGTGETVGGLLHTWIPYGVALGLGALAALAIQLNQLRGIS